MVDLHSSVDSKDRQSMMADANALYGHSFGSAVCWGGEVIAGKVSELAEFLRHVSETYRMTLEKKIFSSRGDEFLIFASQGIGTRICPANAYACRLWTGRYFTPYRHEELTLLHLPAEKDHAFDKAFKKLKGREALPSNGAFVKWCGLAPSKRPFSLVWVVERGWSKLKSKFARVG